MSNRLRGVGVRRALLIIGGTLFLGTVAWMCCSSSRPGRSSSTDRLATPWHSSSTRRSPTRRSRRSPSATCCRTRVDSRATRGRSSVAVSTPAMPSPSGPVGPPRRGTGYDLSILEPQLLPPRPADRGGRRPAVRGRRHGPPADAAGHQGDASRQDVRRRSRRGGPPVGNPAQPHGGPRSGRLLGRHVGRHRDHRQGDRSVDARLAPAVATDDGLDAPADTGRAVPQSGPVVRARADGLR